VNTIRILDLNIWNYNEPWLTRRDLIVDLILDSEPDVVALQEVRQQDWATDPRHQADQILFRLPAYTAVWHPAHYWPADSLEGRQWEGLAILSLHPIVDQAVARLSRAADDPRDHFQRLVLGAQVRTLAGPFWLFNTHFPLSERARNRVVVESFDFVERTAGDLPYAFTGDFNARPHDLPIRFLTGQVEVDGRCGNLVDAWTRRHLGGVGYTYPAWEPRQRIDYVFVSPAIGVQGIAVVGAVASREVIPPSDHCGLLATLELAVGS
jgi:endonuclease/exonuclease/phosphatase family metal-dependent hydrolase